MAMALRDLARPVDAMRERAVLDVARLCAEPHRAAEIGRGGALLQRAVAVVPLCDHRDDGMRRAAVQLRRMRARKPTDIARVLDDCDLQPETDAEVRHFLLA